MQRSTTSWLITVEIYRAVPSGSLHCTESCFILHNFFQNFAFSQIVSRNPFFCNNLGTSCVDEVVLSVAFEGRIIVVEQNRACYRESPYPRRKTGSRMLSAKTCFFQPGGPRRGRQKPRARERERDKSVYHPRAPQIFSIHHMS